MDITALFTNVWSAILVVLFFGGSIFVHELGHFLAARRRGVKVERFSIGFGPKIFSWVGKDGVEYRLSWLPLGGYVALPQLADMSAIEGPASADSAKLPPPSYSTKVMVFAAGAFFNILFAFALGTILWALGQQVAKEEQTNQVGVVLEQIELPNGQMVPGPAFAAGVLPGDIIRSVDGKSVSSLSDIGYLVAIGSGRGANYEPKVELLVERAGQTLPITVFPQKIGAEKVREIGIEPSTKVYIGNVQKGSAAETAGLKANDLITHIDDQPVRYQSMIREHLRKTSSQPVRVTYVREGKTDTLTATPLKVTDPETKTDVYRLGVSLRGELTIETVHIAPWTQIERNAVTTWRTFVSLVSPRSDIGLSKMSGPIGIAERLHAFAQYDFRAVLWFAILINVNLAIFNLLPIPVLDGGHIMFATLAKLRGRALPPQFIAATQSLFMLLLFSMVIYVSFFDVRRIARFRAEEKPVPAQAAQPSSAEPAPAKP
jgi:regulator of sigma E protease